MAPQAGKVLSLSKTSIEVEYKDKTKKKYKLGEWYSRPEAGASYKHRLVTSLSKGDKFKEGDPIYYDNSYFEMDWLYDGKLVYKSGVILRTALMEANQTYEDSNAITASATSKLSVSSSKIHSYIISYDTVITDMVKAGDKVKTGDKLFIMNESAINENIDADTKKALMELARKSPGSKYTGTIGKIIIYHNGDPSEATNSIKKIIKEGDKELSKEKGKKVTGDTKGQLLIEGRPLPKNHIAIFIYVDVEEPYGLGDKGIFANQLKATTGEVIKDDIETENGDVVEALFGDRAVYARIVLSPMTIGTTNALLTVIKDKAVKMYFG